MTQQGDRQASVRAATGTALTYEGDWEALFDQAGVPVGVFNGRLLSWINQTLSTSYSDLPAAQQAFAASQGAYNWSSLGTFTVTPTSAITGLTVVSDTPLLDKTGDYGDATSRIGVNGNGWVAKVTVPYLVGQTFDPTKISLTVSDPGYDGTGTTTVSRTITGRTVLRRQYSANASNQVANDGITLTVYFALSDDIYQGSTLVSGTASSGFYGSSTAGAIASLTNSSTKAYEKPTFAWLNPQHDRAMGAFNVECVAYHRRMQQGRQVGRIEFIATDQHSNTAATQTANSTSLSSLQTKGQIVEAYKATIPVTALTQGDLCLVNAKVYPWLGDSTAILNLTSDGISTSGVIGTANPQTPLRFLNDKSGTYGGAHAAVKIGAVGGTVQSSYASALTTPFPTYQGALSAIVTYNNANKGHNDHSGGTIWLMETSNGAGATHTLGNGSATAGNCLTDVKIDPAATGTVKAQLNSLATPVASMMRFYCNIDQVATNGTFDGGNSTTGNTVVIFEGSTITVGVGFPINYQCGHTQFRNVTWAGASPANSSPFSAFGSSRTQAAVILGNVLTSPDTDFNIQGFAVIGNNFRRGYLNEAAVANRDDQDRCVIANNLLLNIQDGKSSILGNGPTITSMAIVQNVFERATSNTQPALILGGDACVAPLENIVFAFNTIPGGDSGCRFNVAYADVAASAGIIKHRNLLFNLLYQFNQKADVFTVNTSVTGRVGNWRGLYSVGDSGNVVLTGSAGGSSPATDGTSWLGMAWPAATYNVGAGNVTWTNNQSGAGGSGGGTYTLTGSSNAAYGAVPSGFAGLAFDMAGIARKNDGNGASGAYERTV